MKPWILLAVAAFAVAACRTPTTLQQPTVSAPSPEAGVLGKNDVVEVRVFQEPDFSGMYRVSSSGTMDFPFCKNLPVLGLTPEEVAAKLTLCLQPNVLKNPQITVAIREYNSKKVFVAGEVQKPGTFPYTDNMNIIEAITLAGGFTKTAAKNSTTLTRIVEGKATTQKVQVEDVLQGKAPNIMLLPGDIVSVPESFF